MDVSLETDVPHMRQEISLPLSDVDLSEDHSHLYTRSRPAVEAEAAHAGGQREQAGGCVLIFPSGCGSSGTSSDDIACPSVGAVVIIFKGGCFGAMTDPRCGDTRLHPFGMARCLTHYAPDDRDKVAGREYTLVDVYQHVVRDRCEVNGSNAYCRG